MQRSGAMRPRGTVARPYMRTGPFRAILHARSRPVMVKHSGIPGDAPLVLNSPKKTDTDDSKHGMGCGRCPMPDARCLRKLTARLSLC